MNPVEAVSILSQLAYVQPATATAFADDYAWTVGFNNLPLYNEMAAPYTPLYNEFTYASNMRTNEYYRPERVGRQTRYERELFYMTRDMAVLEAIDTVEPITGFYCVRNEPPIESKLSEAAFKLEFNVGTVYPCTGPVHDTVVPKCVCPVPPPPVKLTALAERIKALRAAAPFAVRLRELHAAVADAHKTALTREALAYTFPHKTLLANYTFETWADLGISQPPDWESVSAYKQSVQWGGGPPLGSLEAAAARTAANAAEAELAAFIAEQEDAAFAVFKPGVRCVLTTLRTNALAGYTIPMYPLTVEDLDPLLTELDPPQNKWLDEEIIWDDVTY